MALTFKPGTIDSSTSFFKSVCYGNGRYVAVSDSGYIAYSADGIHFNLATGPAFKIWYGVCYGNGKFVAVEHGGTVAYSTDGGVTFTPGTVSGVINQWNSICYGNGRFVAVTDGAAAYSTNGIDFTNITIPVLDAAGYSVCYGNNKFVSIGSTYVAYSSDGISWTNRNLPSGVIDIFSICYGNGKFVAIPLEGPPIYSTDGGVNFTQGTSSLQNCAVCYGNEFVAVSVEGSYSYSTNGINFIAGTPMSSIVTNQCICYGNNKYVVPSYTASPAVIQYAGSPISFGLSWFYSP